MPRIVQYVFGLAIAMFVLGTPLSYRVYVERTYRNFRVVRPGVLYRSGQLSQAGLERIIHDHDIRTIITLRDSDMPGMLPPDWDEEQYCRKQELYYYRLSPRRWWAEDGTTPAEDNVRKFLQIIDDPKHYPILVHCFAGAHRTGAYCAVYRMEYDHWTNAAAMEELHAGGYRHLYEEEDIRTFLQTYEPRWKRGESVPQARK